MKIAFRIAKHRLAGDPLLQEILMRALARARRQLVVPSRSPVQIGNRARDTNDRRTPVTSRCIAIFIICGVGRNRHGRLV